MVVGDGTWFRCSGASTTTQYSCCAWKEAALADTVGISITAVVASIVVVMVTRRFMSYLNLRLIPLNF